MLQTSPLGQPSRKGNSCPSAGALAAGIGIQNLIEGLATAVALFRDKNMILRAFLIASFTCVVEPIVGEYFQLT